VDAAEIEKAFGWVSDQAIVFHAYTDYMRDYEVITASGGANPPEYDRHLFRNAVEVNVSTTVPPSVWVRSLDDRLIDYATAKTVEGYKWGVKWHVLYPGAKLIVDSKRAATWEESIGVPFHEALIETNAHRISVVFSDLAVTRIESGYAPFVVGGENHYIPPMPLSP
jgi:hypothetical protein